MIAPITFETQFIRVSRSFVLGGRLRALWATKSDCLAPLLPLLLIGRARSSDAYVRWSDLERLSALRDRSLLGALQDLRAERVIDIDPEPGRRAINFAIAPDVLATRDYFPLPGTLVARGLWKSMKESERAVLLTLAAKAKSEVWNWLLAVDSEDPPCGNWAAGLQDREVYVEKTPGLMRRGGVLSLRQLAEIIGLSESTASRATHRLEHMGGGELITCCQGTKGLWYQLPDAVWAPHAAPYGLTERLRNISDRVKP